MLLATVAQPSVPSIHEVVLRGTYSVSEHRLRQRAVEHLRSAVRCQHISTRPQMGLPEVVISLPEWQHPAADVRNFDRLLNKVRQEGPFRLVLSSRDWLVGALAALEVLNRYQNMLPPPPGLCLPGHATASEEALDLWRWVLRLHPSASEAVQRAALSGAAADLRCAQAAQGLTLLRDAADVSFFSARSWEYLRTWGGEQTHCTVARRLGRMSDAAVCHALTTRQPPVISVMFEDFFERRQELPSTPGQELPSTDAFAPS